MRAWVRRVEGERRLRKKKKRASFRHLRGFFLGPFCFVSRLVFDACSENAARPWLLAAEQEKARTAEGAKREREGKRKESKNLP